VDDAWVKPALSAVAVGKPFELSATVRNEDRSLGARLSGELALLRTQQPALQPDIHFRLRGTAGQSFGSFAGEGMKLVLEGQANDFVGKGLSGGEIVIRTRGKLARAESAQVIVGNVALYGATAGSLFAVGSAGERFAIRNSGATAVVEGVGDHACEYMTGGAVLVLGPTGTNFGAGMTGGLAFVWDPTGRFVKEKRFHPEFVGVEVLGACEQRDQELVSALLAAHAAKTGSKVANRLHHGWPVTLRQVVRVAPKS
jgi:glutamate synthase (NADPH/NADH) large chain